MAESDQDRAGRRARAQALGGGRFIPSNERTKRPTPGRGRPAGRLTGGYGEHRAWRHAKVKAALGPTRYNLGRPPTPGRRRRPARRTPGARSLPAAVEPRPAVVARIQHEAPLTLVALVRGRAWLLPDD